MSHYFCVKLFWSLGSIIKKGRYKYIRQDIKCIMIRLSHYLQMTRLGTQKIQMSTETNLKVVSKFIKVVRYQEEE